MSSIKTSPTRTSIKSVKSWIQRPSVISQNSYYDDDDSDNNNDDDDDDSDDLRNQIYIEFIDYYDADNSLAEEEDPIRRVLKNEAYCFDHVRFAMKFVDAILAEAGNEVALMKKRKGTGCKRPLGSISTNSSLAETSTLDSVESISEWWPKISQFNIKAGQEKLENYVSQWQRSSDWYFCVDFLGFESEDCSNVFVYEVEWSKPTMEYPIPQVTASVFFAMEVYKMVPHTHDLPVEVSYIFECSNLIHKPGRIDFQEKWLEDIIEAKLKFFKSITFAIFSTTFRSSVRTVFILLLQKYTAQVEKFQTMIQLKEKRILNFKAQDLQQVRKINRAHLKHVNLP